MIRSTQDEVCAAIEAADGVGKFKEHVWSRAGGGGGISRVLQDGGVWEKAGVNVSVVYGMMPPEAYRAAKGGGEAGDGHKAGPVPFFAAGINSSALPQRGGEVNLTLGGIDLNNFGSVVVREDKKTLLTVLFPDGRDGRAFTLKIFSEKRGQWKAATHSQEFLRTLQRFYSNTYMDAEKQNAINVFLGHFQPQEGKPALWELDSDQHYNIGRRGHMLANENSRSFIKRSLSDGNILCENSTPVSSCSIREGASTNSVLHATIHQKADAQGLSDSTPEISTCENEISCSRCTPVMSRRHFLTDGELNYFNEFKLDGSNCSNFLDLDWISSSGNSCEEENYERSSLINSSVETLSTENVINCMTPETIRDPSENNNIEASEAAGSELSYSAARTSDANMFSKSFINWVVNGEAFNYTDLKA